MIAAPPARAPAGRSGRDAPLTPQRRKLTPEQVAAIRGDAGSRSLRALAADFGVSHETIRAALRPAALAAD